MQCENCPGREQFFMHNGPHLSNVVVGEGNCREFKNDKKNCEKKTACALLMHNKQDYGFFHFRRSAFIGLLTSRVGNIIAKASRFVCGT